MFLLSGVVDYVVYIGDFIFFGFIVGVVGMIIIMVFNFFFDEENIDIMMLFIMKMVFIFFL